MGGIDVDQILQVGGSVAGALIAFAGLMWKAAVEYRKGRDNGLIASEEARKRESERFEEDRKDFEEDRRDWDVERGQYQTLVEEARASVVQLNQKIDQLLQQQREELRKLRELHDVEIEGWRLRREMDLATIHELREFIVRETGKTPPAGAAGRPPAEGSA